MDILQNAKQQSAHRDRQRLCDTAAATVELNQDRPLPRDSIPSTDHHCRNQGQTKLAVTTETASAATAPIVHRPFYCPSFTDTLTPSIALSTNNSINHRFNSNTCQCCQTFTFSATILFYLRKFSTLILAEKTDLKNHSHYCVCWSIGKVYKHTTTKYCSTCGKRAQLAI